MDLSDEAVVFIGEVGEHSKSRPMAFCRGFKAASDPYTVMEGINTSQTPNRINILG